MTALADSGPRPVSERLARHHDVEGDDAGASFSDLIPNERHDITAGDLHVITLMNVRIGPYATRRLLAGPERQWAVAALRRLPDRELFVADAPTLEAMYDFHLAVRHALSNPDVAEPSPTATASTLCARKRRHLFPVLDPVVCTYLGITHLNDVRLALQVFRSLVQDDDVRRALHGLPRSVSEAAGERTVVVDDNDLRLLDAALSTYARGTGSTERTDESAAPTTSASSNTWRPRQTTAHTARGSTDTIRQIR